MSLFHIHTHTHTYTLSLSHLHTYLHSLYLSLLQTHTRTHTHSSHCLCSEIDDCHVWWITYMRACTFLLCAANLASLYSMNIVLHNDYHKNKRIQTNKLEEREKDDIKLITFITRRSDNNYLKNNASADVPLFSPPNRFLKQIIYCQTLRKLSSKHFDKMMIDFRRLKISRPLMTW